MNYKCEICNYSTSRTNNLTRHNNSSKHMKNVYKKEKENKNILSREDNKENNKKHVKKILTKCKKNFDKVTEINDDIIKNEQKLNLHICNFCNKSHKSRQSLWYHNKKCNFKNNIGNTCNKDTSSINEIKSQLDILIKKTNNIINNNTTNNNNTYNTLNINVLTYANQNYTKTEPLKILNQPDVIKLITNNNTSSDHTIEDILIFNYEKQIFDQFIGDIIIKEYKKKDPTVQQFWSSDTSRLSFIVRRILDKNNKIWIKDKKGTVITDFIIVPFLEEIKAMISEYMTICYSMIKTSNSETVEKLTEKMCYIGKIIYDINTKELHFKILKYIAPNFHLDIVNL